MLVRVGVVLIAGALTLAAQDPSVAFRDPVIALEHVRVIDGTGATGRADETLVIDHGKISALGPASSVAVPPSARVLDLKGYTIYPGLVGMHEHLFYPAPDNGGLPVYNEIPFTAPRLYLASGVTTMRTAGSMEPYADINLKQLIDKGVAGPEIDATAPYIQGPGGFSFQMPVIHSADEARRFVDYWASAGATSFKAYMNLSHDALAAAIEEAHRHKLKITGHLCAVGFTEAAELGIDDLEHGLLVDSEFTPGKQQDACPNQKQSMDAVRKLDVNGPELQKLIHTLVEHKVAVTSTLSVFEAFIPGRPPLTQRMLEVLAPQAATNYLASKEQTSARGSDFAPLLKKEMEFERAFVAAGGLLLAGCDPTGNGGALPGFGDQRTLELLVEAGFTPEEAIHIYTQNGAEYLGRADRIGTLAPGKQADIVVVEGNPSERIADVEKVKWVFRNGVGYDSARLIDSVRGLVGME